MRAAGSVLTVAELREELAGAHPGDTVLASDDLAITGAQALSGSVILDLHSVVQVDALTDETWQEIGDLINAVLAKGAKLTKLRELARDLAGTIDWEVS